MAESNAVLQQAYAAFNQRDMDGALEMMTSDVRWPKASEGGSVVGKDEIRAYWTRQWQEFDPTVQPLAMSEQADGSVLVRVRQVVKSIQGELLADSEVVHVFTLRDGLIAAMELGDEQAASAAFAHRS